ncbi:MAG: 50S ribosomal protein L28 [Deltaproteobacteria bacterium]|nr:50S ribosomal protein L28 [Deltaproteobacteria bacterium]
MSNKCEICGKGPLAGNLVSHSNRKTRKVSKPNIQKVKTEIDGTATRIRVCTRCLRSGKVEKRAAN